MVLPTAGAFMATLSRRKPGAPATDGAGCCGKCPVNGATRWRLPARLQVLLLLVWCFAVQMTLRAVISVAILGMEQQGDDWPQVDVDVDVQAEAEAEVEVEREVDLEKRAAAVLQVSELKMDAFTRSLILSAFYWGYVLSQVPGGFLAERLGGKLVLAVSQGASSALALALPLTAQQTGAGGVIAVRFLQGLATGPVYPSLYTLLARWFPAGERQTAAGVVTAAQLLGLGVTLPAAGHLSHQLGWPAVFYVTGGVGLLWLLCWTLFMHDAPAMHPRICRRELALIARGSGAVARTVRPPPYAVILTSAPVWAIVCAEVANSWGQTFLLTYVPIYLKEAVGLDLRASSLLSGVPHVGRGVLSLLLGMYGDLVLRRGWLQLLTLRRLAMTLSFLGCSALLLALALVGAQPVLTTALFCVAGLFTSFTSLGHPLNTIDVSPSFCGTVYGIANTLGSVSSMLSPMAAGALLRGSQPAHQRWPAVFCVAAGVYLAGLVAYLVMASVERQPWDQDDGETEKGAAGGKTSLATIETTKQEMCRDTTAVAVTIEPNEK